MDVTKQYSIAYKGLKAGSHDFNFEVDGALFAAFECVDIKDGACQVEVALGRAETMLTLDVTITGKVVAECDRCLDACDIPIDFRGQLVVKFSEELRDYDGEVMWLSPLESQIELAQYIYESIVLSLPYRRVHPEGTCNPEMLERFRIISDAEFADIEAQAGADEEQQGEWAKLAELKQQMESGGEEDPKASAENESRKK